MSSSFRGGWNPWHGCTKISPGCLNCYVYRGDRRYERATPSNQCVKTSSFNLPVRRKRTGEWAIPSGNVVYTCFTSDFLLADADGWRDECWRMIRERQDLFFVFYTKRILRLGDILPADWGDGYDNVCIGCTVEDMKRADERLPVFLKLPVKHREIIIEPMLERMDISPWLTEGIEGVSAGGESGEAARPCDFSWIVSLRDQCAAAKIPFFFHQTGANFIKDGKTYRIPRRLQHSQARRANVDYDGS